jgi:hypothetical protein
VKSLSIIPACPCFRASTVTCHSEGDESGGEGEEEDKCTSEKLWSFTEAHPAYRTVKLFLYTNIISKHDKQNTLNLESLLFHLKLMVPTNQLSITSFFGKKKQFARK